MGWVWPRSELGAGALARLEEHRTALERTVLSEFTTAPPCRRKVNRPPSETAKALAAELSGIPVQQTSRWSSASAATRS